MKLTPAERAKLESDLAWFDNYWPAIWARLQRPTAWPTTRADLMRLVEGALPYVPAANAKGRPIMAESITLTVPVSGAALAPSEQQARVLADYLRTRDGKTVTVKLSRPTSTRTINQNRFYWGVVLTEIAGHTGHTTEEVHELVKEMFLPRKTIAIGSRAVETQKTTTDLTVTEFAHYLEQIRAWAAQELGLSFPESP